jgi:hypothetical protein
VSIAVFHRRRAERFAQLLDEAEGGRRHHSRSRLDPELGSMVDLGLKVTELADEVGPDPLFRADLRTMLIAAAQRDGIGISAVTPPDGTRVRQRTYAGVLAGGGLRGRISRRLRTRGAIVVSVIAAGTLALSGMSAASGDALPGDPLYGIKRSTERAQLALASSDVTRGQLYLEFAKTRVAEAAAVQKDPAGLAAVLDDMDADTSQGVKLLNTAAVQRREPAALDVVDRFVDDQQRRVSALAVEQQPEASRTRVLGSLTLLESVTRRTAALRKALNCGATSVGTDELGPQPKTCEAAGTDRLERADPADPANRPGPAGGSPAQEEDGGLLADLGRFLDDLLGG